MKKLSCILLLILISEAGCITKSVIQMGRIDGKMAPPVAYQLKSGEIWVKLEPDNAKRNYQIIPPSCGPLDKKAVLSCWAQIPEDYRQRGNSISDCETTTTEMPSIVDAKKLTAISINNFRNEKGKYIVYRESLGDYSAPAYFVAIYDNETGVPYTEITYGIQVRAPSIVNNSKPGFVFYRALLYPPAIASDTALVVVGMAAAITAVVPYCLFQLSISTYYKIRGKEPETKEKFFYRGEDVIKILQHNDGFCELTSYGLYMPVN